jgi:hypothetical protein
MVGLIMMSWGGISTLAVWFVPLTVEELAMGAERVVHGRVVMVEVARNQDGRVFTRATLEVAGVWKGEGGSDRVVVEGGGGVLGDVEVRSSAQVTYGVGEELVLYLVGNSEGTWVPLGMVQGRFKVWRSAGSERAWVGNGFWGGSAPQGTGVRFPAHRPLAMDELRRRTEGVVR